MKDAQVLALLFADKIIVEAGNNKRSIIGTFTRFMLPKFPFPMPAWFIYCAITSIDGEHDFGFKVSEKGEGTEVYSIEGKMTIESKFEVMEITVPVFPSKFEKPGTYSVQFSIDNQVALARDLVVVQSQP